MVTFLGVLFVVTLGWACFYFPFGNGLARLSYDLPFSLRSNIATPEICLVVIDEKSARALNQPVNAPWDLRLHARLVKTLTDAGVRAILFDVVFDSASSQPALDEDFAASIRASGRVFLGAAMRAAPGREVAEEQILPPIPLLRRAAAGWGLVVFRPVDPDSGVRKIFAGTAEVPAITWKVARYLGAALPETPSTEQTRWLDYYAPAGIMPAVRYNEALRKHVHVGGLRALSDKNAPLISRWQKYFRECNHGHEIFIDAFYREMTSLLNLGLDAVRTIDREMLKRKIELDECMSAMEEAEQVCDRTFHDRDLTLMLRRHEHFEGCRARYHSLLDKFRRDFL